MVVEKGEENQVKDCVSDADADADTDEELLLLRPWEVQRDGRCSLFFTRISLDGRHDADLERGGGAMVRLKSSYLVVAEFSPWHSGWWNGNHPRWSISHPGVVVLFPCYYTTSASYRSL